MIALALGEVNKLNPNPVVNKQPTTVDIELISSSSANDASPTAVTSIPSDAMMRGSKRSDNLPAAGETTAIISGCAMRTKPVVPGAMPLRY